MLHIQKLRIILRMLNQEDIDFLKRLTNHMNNEAEFLLAVEGDEEEAVRTKVRANILASIVEKLNIE